MEKEEEKNKKYHRYNRTGEDIDMINERRYRESSNYSHRNICDTHEDGA